MRKAIECFAFKVFFVNFNSINKREGKTLSFVFGAGDVTRTHDLLITNQLHYRLCYTSDLYIIFYFEFFVKCFFKKILTNQCF